MSSAAYATTLQQSSQSNLGNFPPGSLPVGTAPIFESPPNSGGYNPVFTGQMVPNSPISMAQAANGGYTYTPSSISSVPVKTSGAVSESQIAGPSTTDGSLLGTVFGFFGSAASAVASPIEAVYNNIAGPTTVLGNLPAGVSQTVAADASGIVSGVSSTTGAAVGGVESVASGIASGASNAVKAAENVVTGAANYFLVVVVIGLVALYVVANGKNSLVPRIGA